MQRKNPGKAMRYLVAVCALVSALAMVGCGGDGDDDGGTVTSGQTIPSVNTGAVNRDRQQCSSPGRAAIYLSKWLDLRSKSRGTTQLHLLSPVPTTSLV